MISVIIPTLNRAESLALTLESLVCQSALSNLYEIIVVDNGSTDRTQDVTRSAIAANPNHKIRYVYEPEPGLLSGRHRGAVEANGDIAIFVDDDIDADPRWLQSIADTFEDPTVQLVGGKNLPKYEITPPDWLEGFWSSTPYGGRACGDLSLLDLGDRAIDINPNYIWGLNFAIRKQALFDLGGFHPDCIAENLQHFQGDGETGLTMKATEKGYRAVYQPQALVYHRTSRGRLTPQYFEKRAFYQGVCNSYTTIRRERQISGDLQQSNVPRSPIDRLRQHIRHPIASARNFVRRISPKPQRTAAQIAIDRELAQIQQAVQVAYQAGYTFHQNAVRKSPALLAWVLKDDYWDYKLPKLAEKSDR